MIRTRDETIRDVAAIRDVTTRAFAAAEHKSGTEADIIDRLRRDGALAVSLVADDDGIVVGHVAISPVAIDGTERWFGLGPVAVLPDHQRQGIGQRLIRDALRRVYGLGGAGCVVLGNPAYYGRFGFVGDPALRFGDAPPGYLQRLGFGSDRPVGEVAYHPAFSG